MFIYFLAMAALYQSYLLSYLHSSDITSYLLWFLSMLPVVVGAYFTLHDRKVMGLFCICALGPFLIQYLLISHADRFPHEKVDAELTVKVLRDSELKHWGSKTVVLVSRAEHCEESKVCQDLVGKKIVLNNYQTRSLDEVGRYLSGQRLQAKVRLKPILGFLNPGGFDYEYWQYTKGIYAKGYFKNIPTVVSEHYSTVWYHKMHRQLSRYVENDSDNLERGRSLLLALILGDRSSVSFEDKQTLATSGLIHLFVISGLHIGLLFGAVLWLVRSCVLFAAMFSRLIFKGRSRCLPSLQWFNLIAVCFTWWYVDQIGYPIPAFRALLFLTLWQCIRLLSFPLSTFQILALTVWLILWLLPEQLFSMGFWMSVLAVASLVLTSWGVFERSPEGRKGLWARIRWVLRAQLYVSLALMPFSVLFVNQVNVFSILWNLFLIPVFSLIVVPLLLFLSLLMEISIDGAMLGLDVLASALVQIIDGVSLAESFLDGVNREYILDKTEDDMSWLNESIPLVLIVILIFICLSPVHRRIKLVVSGLVLLVLVVKPRQGSQFEIWFLDVGQAQSVVAVKDNRALVYDVGFGRDGFNASDAVIVPFLKSRHIRSVDHLIVSHKDTDHSGGLKSLLESAYAPRHLVIPESLDHVMIKVEGLGQTADVSRCNKDQRFLWGEVEVHYLWPKEEHKELSSNDSSCVVFLEYQGVSILLTGDVTASVESKLIEQYEARLKKVDIMSVPHHGSKTSSSPEFLDAVDARWAVSSSGSLNRFNHPAPTIVDRYQVRGIKFFSTAESGALGFIVDEELDIEIAHWLSKEEAYWRSNRWGK